MASLECLQEAVRILVAERQALHGGDASQNCFLEDVYTQVERTLIEAGRFDTGRETRNAFQGGRKMIRFLSQVHVNPDLSIETFILELDVTCEAVDG